MKNPVVDALLHRYNNLSFLDIIRNYRGLIRFHDGKPHLLASVWSLKERQKFVVKQKELPVSMTDEYLLAAILRFETDGTPYAITNPKPVVPRKSSLQKVG